MIYTSAIRDLLKTYLTDDRYEDCPWKQKWFDEIKKKLADPDSPSPDSLISRENDEVEINSEAERWIENVAMTFVSNLPDTSGKKLIDKFIFANNSINTAETEEGEL